MKSGVARGGRGLLFIFIFILSAQPFDRADIYWEGRARSQLKSVWHSKKQNWPKNIARCQIFSSLVTNDEAEWENVNFNNFTIFLKSLNRLYLSNVWWRWPAVSCNDDSNRFNNSLQWCNVFCEIMANTYQKINKSNYNYDLIVIQRWQSPLRLTMLINIYKNTNYNIGPNVWFTGYDD